MGNKIILVAETGADITQENATRYGIYIVPMYVTMGDKTLKDGSFPVTDLYDFYEKTGSLPKTSAPNPEDYRMVFDDILAKWPEAQILHLCYSKVTSAAFQNARIASEDLHCVTSLDSKGVTGGQGSLVIRTARYIEEHPEVTVEELVPLVESWITKSRMVFLPGSLEYLRAGGRVSNAAYLGASLLSLKPLIEILDGKLVSTKKYRGKMNKAIEKTIDDFFEKNDMIKDDIYILWSVGLSQELKDLIISGLKKHGVDAPIWNQTGTVITTHCGPGAFGLAGFAK